MKPDLRASLETSRDMVATELLENWKRKTFMTLSAKMAERG